MGTTAPPLVALSVPAPAQQPGVLAQLQQGLSLKAMMNQQQTSDQQQQLNAQKIQEGQQSLSDQQVTTAAMKEWDGKNLDDLPGIVLKKGGSSTAVLGLKKQVLDQKKSVSDMAKTDADTLKTKLENESTKNDYLSQQIDGLKTLVTDPKNPLAPQAAAAQFESIKQKAIQDGHLDPQSAQGIQLDPSKPIADQLQGFEDNLLGHKKVVDALKAHADIAKSDAETEKAKAETAQLQEGGTAAAADAKYRRLQANVALGVPVSAEDKAFLGAYEKQKTISSTNTFNLQNAGATGTPGNPSAIAKGLADGSMKWNDIVSVRTPMSVKTALLNEVKGIKPDYNSGDFEVEQGVKKQATSGQVGQQLLAIGTAREHMKLFSQLADALDSGNVQALNKIGNAFGIEFGSDKATNFKIAQQAFGGEVGKALDGAGVVAGEREQAQKAFDAAMSKGQFKGAVQTVDKLLAGKQKAAHDWFDQGVQAKPNFGQESAAPAAQSQGHKVGDTIVQNGKQFKATAVDKDGKVTAANPL